MTQFNQPWWRYLQINLPYDDICLCYRHPDRLICDIYPGVEINNIFYYTVWTTSCPNWRNQCILWWKVSQALFINSFPRWIRRYRGDCFCSTYNTNNKTVFCLQYFFNAYLWSTLAAQLLTVNKIWWLKGTVFWNEMGIVFGVIWKVSV